jgi:hypothetical protein
VKDDARRYPVFKGLISYHSDFFRGAFRSGMAETLAGEVKLPVEEEEGFKLFRQWLYTGTMYDVGQELDLSSHPNSIAFFEGYVFADSKGVPTMKNYMTDYLIKRREEQKVIPTSAIRYVWANTAEGDGMRKLFIDLLTMVRLGKGFFGGEGKAACYPKDLLMNVVRVLEEGSSRDIRTPKGWQEARCQYHDHSENAVRISPTLETEGIRTTNTTTS